MRRNFGLLALAGALALAGHTWPANRGRNQVRAAAEPAPIRSDRGGFLVAMRQPQFEVFFYKTGLRIFPRRAEGGPIPVSKLTGSAAFLLPGAPQPLVYPLKGGAPIRGHEQESIDLSADLSWVPVGEAKVRITIEGLPDPAEKSVSFTVPFELVTRPQAALPATASPAASPVSATAPPSAPGYVYQAGYYGYGYYPSASPARPGATAPAPAQYRSPQAAVPLDRSWMRPSGSGRNFYTQVLFGG